MNQSINQWLNRYPDSTVGEMRSIRRELINYHLQNARITVFFLRDVKFLVRNGEVYRHGQELKSYQ